MVGPGNMPPRSVSTSGLAGFVRTYLTPESRSALVAQHVDFSDDRALLRGITTLPGRIALPKYMFKPESNFPSVTLDLPNQGRVRLGFLSGGLNVYPAPPQGGPGFHEMRYTVESGWYFGGTFSVNQLRGEHRDVDWRDRSKHYRNQCYEQDAHLIFGDGTSTTITLLAPHLFAHTLDPSVSATFLSESDGTLNVTVSSAKKNTTPWQPTRQSDLRREADAWERTDRGTMYYFRQGKPIGYSDRTGNAFRYREVASGENFASHAAILARQGRTLPPPIRARSAIEAELEHGAAAIRERLADISFQRFAVGDLASVNDDSALRMIGCRALTWSTISPPGLCPLSQLLGLGHVYESKAFRFLWLHGCEDLGRALYVSAHDTLTHYQQLLILFGPQWVERDLLLPPEESFIARHVRGGLMVVDFGNRAIDAIRIQPWGMALPHYHRSTPNGAIMLLTTDSDNLSRKLARHRKGQPGAFPTYA